MSRSADLTVETAETAAALSLKHEKELTTSPHCRIVNSGMPMMAAEGVVPVGPARPGKIWSCTSPQEPWCWTRKKDSPLGISSKPAINLSQRVAGREAMG